VYHEQGTTKQNLLQ